MKLFGRRGMRRRDFLGSIGRRRMRRGCIIFFISAVLIVFAAIAIPVIGKEVKLNRIRAEIKQKYPEQEYFVEYHYWPMDDTLYSYWSNLLGKNSWWPVAIRQSDGTWFTVHWKDGEIYLSAHP